MLMTFSLDQLQLAVTKRKEKGYKQGRLLYKLRCRFPIVL
uniref:Uncharacterized protein n=1 Tax=Lepeophtheirus salmonis TaxID=72036 RepID=A0A0K2THV4_LEPSM